MILEIGLRRRSPSASFLPCRSLAGILIPKQFWPRQPRSARRSCQHPRARHRKTWDHTWGWWATERPWCSHRLMLNTVFQHSGHCYGYSQEPDWLRSLSWPMVGNTRYEFWLRFICSINMPPNYVQERQLVFPEIKIFDQMIGYKIKKRGHTSNRSMWRSSRSLLALSKNRSFVPP